MGRNLKECLALGWLGGTFGSVALSSAPFVVVVVPFAAGLASATALAGGAETTAGSIAALAAAAVNVLLIAFVFGLF